MPLVYRAEVSFPSIPLTGGAVYAGLGTTLGVTAAGSAGQVLTSNGVAAPTWQTPAAPGTGTVTSVALTVPSGLTVAGSPITTSGTLAVSLTGGAVIPVPSALTKTDDTNVTLTLGGSPSTALINAASLTLGWTGQLALSRGGSAANLTAVNGGAVYSTASALAITAAGTSGQVLTSQGAAAPIWSTPASVTPAALTRTDDTNVTLTLGGTPSTALLQATSITAGWTGQLSVARGGTGLSTLTAHALYVGNGTSAPTALSVGATGTVLIGATGADPSFSATPDITSMRLSTTTAALPSDGLLGLANGKYVYWRNAANSAWAAGFGSDNSNNARIGGGSGSAVSSFWGNNTTDLGDTSNVWRTAYIGTSIIMSSGANVVANATTGTKIGTGTSQKLSLWNATPVVQPTAAGAAATFVANTSNIVDDSATFDGYTLGQVVKALRTIGVLA